MSQMLGAFQSEGTWVVLDYEEPEEAEGQRCYLVRSNEYADSWTMPATFSVDLVTPDYEEAKAEFFRILGINLDLMREALE